MAFELNSVVPWGRTRNEYEKMFMLTSSDLKKQIISFGDGPASFNAEMTVSGNNVKSLDPIYQFTVEQLRQRIDETSEQIVKQMEANRDKFVWSAIKSVDELKAMRMGAMKVFLSDFEAGLNEQRYIPHLLPAVTNFADNTFEIGLSSHFLLLYEKLGLEFHKASITEMMRICREVRIFPVLNLNAEVPQFMDDLLTFLNANYNTKIVEVDYEFQKDGNKMLLIVK
jgi:hypothetical protein